jgi:uncharacterized protein (TIGR00255 family)
MISSMTGYGKGEASSDGLAINIELRSVNHRYADISIKAPRFLLPFENELRKLINQKLKRGKIDLYIQTDFTGDFGQKPVLNKSLAEAYMNLFADLSQHCNLQPDVPVELVANQRDVITVQEQLPDEEEAIRLIRAAVESGLERIVSMRQAEGEAMQRDMAERLDALKVYVVKVEQRAPVVVTEWQQKLKDRLARLPEDVSFDPQRVAQEIAVFADRCDITEEVTRFRSHIDQFELLFQSDEPVGRKMDFLSQELNREANTMGSKANDAELARVVVEMKAELEKVREQVQNIE